jgi:hypothetical protein
MSREATMSLDTFQTEVENRAPSSVKRCSNPACQVETVKLTTGRCNPCYRWFKKHSTERVLPVAETLEGDVAQEEQEAVVQPEIQAEQFQNSVPIEVPLEWTTEQSEEHAAWVAEMNAKFGAMPETEEGASVVEDTLPETEEGDTPSEILPLSSTASSAFDAKVQRLLALAQEGPEALAQAIRTGLIQVRTGRLPRTPRIAGVPIERKMGTEKKAQLRERASAGESIVTLAEAFGISKVYAQRIAQGTETRARGAGTERTGLKMTAEKKAACKAAAAQGASLKALALQYEISTTYAQRICKSA